MPVYEITWRIDASSEEAALDIFQAVKSVHKGFQSVMPAKVSLTLKRVIDDGEENTLYLRLLQHRGQS
jgi:hypothetical protein